MFPVGGDGDRMWEEHKKAFGNNYLRFCDQNRDWLGESKAIVSKELWQSLLACIPPPFPVYYSSAETLNRAFNPCLGGSEGVERWRVKVMT